MGVFRLASAVAAVPAGGLASLIHRLATGPEAILEIDVGLIADLRGRQQWIHQIRRAAADPLVAAVLFRFHAPIGGWAACQDLREAILALRRAGRPVYAVLEAPGNALTWLASAADRVFMIPTGELGLVGVGIEMTFFGEALSRLGVRPDFEAAGAYKSFGEPFTRSFPSPENHEAVRALVDDLHEQLIEGIAEARSQTPDAIRALLERAPLSASEALEAGLIDQLAYPDQITDWIQERHGSRSRRLAFRQWALRDRIREWIGRWGAPSTSVGVLHLQGPVVVEEAPRGPSIAARKVGPILRALREDDDVGAVVLHINSPGGSALASDLIWREVDELSKIKPVVASFEDTAASGGYYIAAPAAEILVRPGTLTGSIGVFGGKLVLAEGLRRVGVHSREVLGAPNANLFSAAHHFSEPQRVRFRRSLQRFYDGFVQRVADGRGKEEAIIEPHCRGRVWTGRAALQRELADRSGALDDAVDRARSLAGLSEGQFVRKDLSAYQVPLAARLTQAMMRRHAPAALADLGLLGSALRLAQRALPGASGVLAELILTHPEQPLAVLPFELEPR
ncbi:MAG TPA: hypothetical protein ENK18_17695 [Deltaproteobacteria bacterium]|nr:hypothetical protein [Deltaproteobacteria bacterium]